MPTDTRLQETMANTRSAEGQPGLRDSITV